ncbi:uncharacterized protein LOC114527326 [Dendronephthya gigantea]|uniref:uncharacterized protein LOC114527326 n=1 Tax=Dendronephthya gigantea TaxID=151771 RepID=UPI0010694067|nr:uncharacterized protein LOC114527326 [Dendronephthya gigantea]
MGNEFQKTTENEPEIWIHEEKWIKVVKDFKRATEVLEKNRIALDEHLIQLDESRKVVSDEPRNRALAEQAELYTREILDEVERLDPRFKSTFLKSGSFYDDAKVGLPDEYDYMAKLVLLSKPGIGRAVPTKLGFARIILEDEKAKELWEQFLCEDSDEDTLEVFKSVLSISKLQEEFRSLVMKAIKSVKMPSKWQRDPCPEQHGPCAMLEFLVDDFLPEGQLYISIDLAPCITYPNHKDIEFPFYRYLDIENSFATMLTQIVAEQYNVLLVPFIDDGVKLVKKTTCIYRQSFREQMRVSFSMVEKDIFANFACNSIEKRVLRLLKILRDIHLKDDEKRQEWEDPVPDEPPSTKMENITTIEQYVPPKHPKWFWDYVKGKVPYKEGELKIEKDNASVSDLLQTYVFKSLFFYTKLFSTDEERWKPGNLSGTLLKCLDDLFNVYSVPNAALPNFFFDGYTGKKPNYYKQKKILMGMFKLARSLQVYVDEA